jgi:exopolysaccharide biosynthesis polyprenyl glycosylphosphotransferase
MSSTRERAPERGAAVTRLPWLARNRQRPIFDAPSRPAVSARDRLSRRSLGVADGLAASVALVVGVAVIGEDAIRPVAVLFVPLAVLLSKCIGLYDRDELLLHKTTLDDTPALFQLATIYTLLVWLLEPLVIVGYLGRTQVLGLWALLVTLGLFGRLVARTFARRRAGTERCLLIGDADAGHRLAEQLTGSQGVEAAIAQRIDLAGDDPETAARRIEEAVRGHEIHRVVLAPRTADSDGVLDAIRVSKALGVKVSLLPRVFEVVGSSVEFDELSGMTVLGLRRSGLSRSSWMLKRAMDWTGALALLVLTSPLLLLIAIAIKLVSRGPVLFRQTRVGRDGRRFQMLKFRTMVDRADTMKAGLRHRNETDGLFKIANDPRVTPVGRLLRRTSLDELPQLINVLRGEMSLVGPRPLVVDEDHKVRGWDRRRLQLTPGITGPWQILGSARVPLREMVKIDYLYVANWSLWGDVKILLRTIPYMIRRRGM